MTVSLSILIPCILLSSLSKQAKGSKDRMKHKGERTHPLRVPLWRVKASDIRPLAQILAVGDLYKSYIFLIKFAPKPNSFYLTRQVS